MKKLTLYPKRLNSQKCSLRAIIILLLIITCINTYGQAASELRAKLTELKISGDSVMIKEAARIESLIYSLQPTLYIEQGVQKTFGETPPVRIIIDALSVSKLKDTNPLFSQVEIITIKINDPADFNIVLDLTALPAFTNLKYIHFLCSLNCTPENITKLYTPFPGVSVFYIVSLPS